MKKMGRKNNLTDFWDRLDTSSNCWEWTKSCSKSGYGKTYYQGKEWRSHRLAYFLTYNILPKMVLHVCDNRKCCNPFHLFAGDHKDNMKDMAIKGRAARQKGSSHGQSKLVESQVIEMRKEFKLGRSLKELATKYKIHKEYVRQIINYKRWSHV